MRRITSKSEEAKRSRRNQFILGGILIFVMFISVLGYGFQTSEGENGEGTFEYNGYDFIGQNGVWYLELGDFVLSFKYNPEQVPTISGDVDSLSVYANEPLYISSQTQEAEFEIYRNFDQVILRRQYACLEGEECIDSSYPVKTCQDKFIIIREAEEPNIIQNESCVFIEGPKENITQITDEFLYKTTGIK